VTTTQIESIIFYKHKKQIFFNHCKVPDAYYIVLMLTYYNFKLFEHYNIIIALMQNQVINAL